MASTLHVEKDLAQYILTSAEESTYLEFKHGNALVMDDRCKNEIAKDISAFANADGGILIYGMEEKDHVAAAIAPMDGTIFTKEWLEQVINSRIRRNIPELIIDPIRIGGDVKKSVYVVRIPKSPFAPHQTLDKHFYRRRNFQVVEMEEFEIRESYLRPARTVLRLNEPKITASVGLQSARKIVDYYVKATFFVENIGTTIEDKYKLEVRVPRQQHSTSVTPDDKFFHAPYRNEGEYHIYTFPNTSVLFQGEIAPMATVTIKVTLQNIDVLDQLPLIAKVYYSSGTEQKEILLLPNCKHEDHQLARACFELRR